MVQPVSLKAEINDSALPGFLSLFFSLIFFFLLPRGLSMGLGDCTMGLLLLAAFFPFFFFFFFSSLLLFDGKRETERGEGRYLQYCFTTHEAPIPLPSQQEDLSFSPSAR